MIIPLGYLIKSDPPKLQNTFQLRPKKFQSESSAKKVKGTLSVSVTYIPEPEAQEIEQVPVSSMFFFLAMPIICLYENNFFYEGKSDLIQMAAKVKQNLLDRIAASNTEVCSTRRQHAKY